MKKNVVSIIGGFLAVAALGLTACSAQVKTSTTTSTAPATTSSVPATTATTTLAAEAPTYGGRLTSVVTSNPSGFDPSLMPYVITYSAYSLSQDSLAQGNWALGPAGTNEVSWQAGNMGRMSLLTGALAESWDISQPGTGIFHIRKGVHFWNKPPVNGREVTADDIVWNMKWQWTAPKGDLFGAVLPEDRPTSFTALDKYTVEVKIPSGAFGLAFLRTICEVPIFAPEVVTQYGSYTDWKNMNGTGPFMLTDYVSGSSITTVRNPNYWQKDPLHPNNQLPYIDGVTLLMISDHSTLLAAFRTARIDVPGGANVSWEDHEQLMKANAQLKSKQFLVPTAPLAVGREDKPDLPFKDIRVRQAMNLAVDQNAILQDYYGGQGVLLDYPYQPLPESEAMYTPLDQMPTKTTLPGSESTVPELLSYNPDKAKQLLAEAGYPNGFTTQIVVGTSDQSDLMSIVKEDLSKVGIDMQINQVETGVWNTMQRSKTAPQMIYYSSANPMNMWDMMDVRTESFKDNALFEDPTVRAAYNESNKYFTVDDTKWMQVMKAVGPTILESSFSIWLPEPYNYSMWWPWVQNYHGEEHVGYFMNGVGSYAEYLWIDQRLKTQMGH